MTKVSIKKEVMFWIFTLLATAPLYFRGLFFQQDFAVFTIIALAFLILSVVTKEAKITFNLMTDLALGIFVLFYLISSAFAVNLNLALGETIKYLVVYLIYLAAKSFFRDEITVRKGLYAIVVIVAGMSLISLSSAAGLFVYPGAYSDSEIERWLNGTVQYHNAFGALTLMALFMACALGSFKSLKNASNWGIALCSYLLMFGLIMSYSRGAWVLAPVLFIVYMIFGDKPQRVAFFSYVLPAGISVIAVLSKFSAYVVEKNTGMAVLWFFIGLAIFAVLYVFISWLLHKLSAMKHFNLVAIIIIIVGILGVVLIVLMPQLFSFLPAQLMERISGINLGSETVQERFVFYQDAFQIAQRNLLIGNGGGAWQDLYGMYQSYLYYSTQAHSYIMQILVETGILGMLSWIAAVVLFYFLAIRAFLKKSVSKDILNAIICGVSALLLHSFIDFDLSLPAITIILWVLIAMLTALTVKKERNIRPAISIAVSAVLIVVSIATVAAYGANQHGDALMDAENYQEAYQKYHQATIFAPFNPEYLTDKALAKALSSNKVSDRQEAVALFDKAVSFAPYHLDVQQAGIGIYSAIGSEKYALDCVDNTIKLQPMNPNNYMAYLQSAANIMPAYIADGAYDKAKALAEAAMEIPSRAEAASQGKLKPVELPGNVANFLVYFAKILSSISA